MNLFICKAKVVTTPRLFLHNNNALVQMIVCLTNFKKGSSWYYLYTKARGRLAHQVFDLCVKGNIVLIHGHIKIRFKRIYISRNKFKNKKFLILNIKKVYPAKIVS